MSGRRFTPEEDDAIRCGRAAGLSATEIGATIGRTRCQVRGRIGWLHLPALPSETVMALKGAECRRANAARAEDAAERWTPEQDALIREMWKKPLTAAQMAAAVGRSEMAVRSRVHRALRLGDRDPAVLAEIQRKAHEYLRVTRTKTKKKPARSSPSSHSWSVSGRVRVCIKCGAKQYLSMARSGTSISPVWVCDAPPCRMAA